MAKFRIMPHGRLQEWVAEEKGYFQAEGLDYEFVYDYSAGTSDSRLSLFSSEMRLAWEQ